MGIRDRVATAERAPSAEPAGSTDAPSVIDGILGLLAGEDVAPAAGARPKAEAAPVAPAPTPVMRPCGEPYIPRPLVGSTDVEFLRANRGAFLPTMLEGYPGSGKTACGEAAFGDDLITFAGHADAAVEDLVGGYVQDPDRSFRWVDGPLVRALKEGKVLFVDDATLTPSGVLARLYPAMDGRGQIVLTEHGGEVVRAAAGFFIVGAHNPGVPGAVLSEALSSRFRCHLPVESDLSIARDVGVNPKMIKVAARMQAARRDAQLAVPWAPEMRELLTFKAIEELHGTAAAVGNLINIAPEPVREELSARAMSVFGSVVPLVLANPLRS